MAKLPIDEMRCRECGGEVKPFGTTGQLFGVDDDLLCLACARRLMPERVAIAEAFEAEWNSPKKLDEN